MLLQYIIEKPNAMLSDKEILETLSEKSGIDFRDSTIQKVEKVHISDYDSAIYVILQIDETKKSSIEDGIIRMRYEKLNVNDTFFPKIWKNIVGVTDYECYEFKNGARKYTKSLNRTTCLFILDQNECSYTVYVKYTGD